MIETRADKLNQLAKVKSNKWGWPGFWQWLHQHYVLWVMLFLLTVSYAFDSPYVKQILSTAGLTPLSTWLGFDLVSMIVASAVIGLLVHAFLSKKLQLLPLLGVVLPVYLLYSSYNGMYAGMSRKNFYDLSAFFAAFLPTGDQLVAGLVPLILGTIFAVAVRFMPQMKALGRLLDRQAPLTSVDYGGLFAVMILARPEMSHAVMAGFLPLFRANSLFFWLESLLLLALGFLFFGLLGSHLSLCYQALASRRQTVRSAVFISFVLAYLAVLVSHVYINQAAVGSTAYKLLPEAFNLTVVCVFLLNVLIYFVINRLALGTVLVFLLNALLAGATFAKLVYRGEPVFLSDIQLLASIKDLLGFLSVKMVFVAGLVIVLTVAFALAWQRRFRGSKGIASPKKRLAVVLGTLLLLFAVGRSILISEKDEPVFLKVPYLTDYLNIDNFLWLGPETTEQYAGIAYLWVKQMDSHFVAKPQDYDETMMATIKDKYSQVAAELNQDRPNEISDRIVVYVLSESLSNPNRVPGVTLSANPLANIDQVKSETTSGLMVSSGYGGGTANMEYEALTSLSLNNFLGVVSTPYQQVVSHMSYIPSVNRLFQESVAIHPNGGEFYGRNTVFDDMHFNKFYATENTDYNLKDVTTQGFYPEDSYSYRQAIDQIKQFKAGGFVHLITMQNHMPYTADEFPENIQVASDDLDKTSLDALTGYTNGIYQTDQATQQFLNEIAAMDKPVTVVFWGDHLPGIYEGDQFTETFSTTYFNLKHETDYFVWQNHDTQKLDYPVVAPYDFTPIMLEMNQAKVSPYQALMTKVAKELPTMELHQTFGSDGKIDKNVQLSRAQSELLADYKAVQYDITTGQGYLAKNEAVFFKVSP